MRNNVNIFYVLGVKAVIRNFVLGVVLMIVFSLLNKKIVWIYDFDVKIVVFWFIEVIVFMFDNVFEGIVIILWFM